MSAKLNIAAALTTLNCKQRKIIAALMKEFRDSLQGNVLEIGAGIGQISEELAQILVHALKSKAM